MAGVICGAGGRLVETNDDMFILPTLLLSGLAISPMQVKDKIYTATANGNKNIGSLKWVITDRVNKQIGKGEKKVLLKDVRIRVRGGPFYAEFMEIALSDNFVLSKPNIRKGTSDLIIGFALNVMRDDMDVFSWDWFNVEGNLATKMRESGKLGIAFARVGKTWELVRTEFLSDVSLRMKILGDDKRTWRVKVFKGSTVTWPSLVDGKVIAN